MSYKDDFNHLANTLEGFEGIKGWFPIDETIEVDMDQVLGICRKSIQRFIDLRELGNTHNLSGDCFGIIYVLSQELWAEGIKHTHTVGNVFINDKPYYEGVTNDSIQSDLVPDAVDYDTPVNSHTWITLEDGTIIDATILPSLNINRRKKKKALNVVKALYDSKSGCNRIDDKWKIDHKPYYLGPDYYLKVVFDGENTPNFEASMVQFTQLLANYRISSANAH